MVLGIFRPQNFEEGKKDDKQRGKGRKRTEIDNGNVAGMREKMHQKLRRSQVRKKDLSDPVSPN